MSDAGHVSPAEHHVHTRAPATSTGLKAGGPEVKSWLCRPRPALSDPSLGLCPSFLCHAWTVWLLAMVVFVGSLPWAPPRLLLEGHLHGSVCLWFHVAVHAGSRLPHWSREPLRRECPNPASLVLCAGGLSEQVSPPTSAEIPQGGRAWSGWARFGCPARPGGLLVGLPGHSRPPPGHPTSPGAQRT